MEQEAWQVLIVEDDQRLAELTREYLQANGLRVEIEGNGALAAARIIKEQPDLVILDLMLPGLDGLHVCRLLRADSAGLPILMLTARDDSHDQVLGLEMGADDYVTKPCEPRVLLARVRTLLRRSSLSEPQVASDQILMGNLCIDLSERTVTWRACSLWTSATRPSARCGTPRTGPLLRNATRVISLPWGWGRTRGRRRPRKAADRYGRRDLWVGHGTHAHGCFRSWWFGCGRRRKN